MRKLFGCFSLLLITVLVAACTDTERLDHLEAEIRGIKSDTKREVQEIKSLVATGDIGDTGGSSLSSRVDALEQRMTKVLERYDDQGGKIAYLRQNANGHGTMATDHGNFLIRLEGIDFNVGGSGFTARLNIGNLGALAIQQFVLKGDFGAGVPNLAPGQEYSAYNKEIEQWQKTLTPFQFRITRQLQPMAWTPVEVVLDATSRDDLELIRFSMLIENAHLDGIETNKSSDDEAYAHITVGRESASLLKTDYGAFLVMINKATPSGDGTKLEVEIGNPYSFVVNKCRLTGSFGNPLPQKTAGETHERFLGRLREWMGALQPFDSPVSGKLQPGKWTSTTILVPGSVSQVQFLRARLGIEYVTLPQK